MRSGVGFWGCWHYTAQSGSAFNQSLKFTFLLQTQNQIELAETSAVHETRNNQNIQPFMNRRSAVCRSGTFLLDQNSVLTQMRLGLLEQGPYKICNIVPTCSTSMFCNTMFISQCVNFGATWVRAHVTHSQMVRWPNSDNSKRYIELKTQ